MSLNLNNLYMNNNLPRGFRNHNPLNIKKNPANKWQGLVDNPNESVFETFSSDWYGYRAAAVIIRRYIGRGLNTLVSIIRTWAPSSDNNPTSAYINYVSNHMSPFGAFPITLPICPNDIFTITSLIMAMAVYENGDNDFVKYDLVDQGLIYDAVRHVVVSHGN